MLQAKMKDGPVYYIVHLIWTNEAQNTSFHFLWSE